MRIRGAGAQWVMAAALILAACGSNDAPENGRSSAPPATTASITPSAGATTTAAAPAPPVAQAKNWFDLDVGDCLASIPQVDLGEVSVPVVDCATAHQAEVFLRVPIEVNAALADVADQKCDAGASEYTGHPAGDSRFDVTYLIDSNQDRTAANPLPSTVICLLQSGDGSQLTASARR
jgi:hypothetical protein